MSIVAVLEIIGKGIAELKTENEALRYERDRLKESEKRAWEECIRLRKENGELQFKLDGAQDYADSLAQECENVSKSEEIKESGC